MRVLLLLLTLITLAAGQGVSAVPGASPRPAQSSVTPPLTGGVIAGTVVDAATGAAIAGAVVHIAPAVGTLAATPLQLTDPKGRFLFANLPAGAYSLTASRTGYAEGGHGRDLENGIASTPIAIQAGQRFMAAKILMSKPSAISGIVTDEAGEPMVNVFVRAVRVEMISGTERLAAGRVTSTDDRGAYRLSALSPGRYIVMLPSVSASTPAARTSEVLARSRESQSRSSQTIRLPRPDGALSGEHSYVLIAGAYPTPPGPSLRAYPPLFHPAARHVGGALPISLSPGEERAAINFVWAPVPAATISGRLLGPGDAVANMVVRLATPGAEAMPPGSEAATTLSGADGSFTFLRVPHGQYVLIASRAYAFLSDADGRVLPTPPGYRPGWGGGGSIPGQQVGYGYQEEATVDTHTARQPLAVGGGPIRDLTVHLQPNVRLRGRVVIESGAFAIQGASGGGPVPAATGRVTAEPANGDMALGMPGGPFDSTAGTFSVDGLLPGEYTLRFMGLPPIKTIVIAGADYTTRPIDTATTRGLDDIVVTVTDKVARLSGTVRSEKEPLEASVVLYFPTDRAQWSRYGLRPTRIGSAPVSSGGQFSIQLPAGEYFVAAVPAADSRRWQDPKRLEPIAAAASRVKLEWDDKRSLDLTVRVVR